MDKKRAFTLQDAWESLAEQEAARICAGEDYADRSDRLWREISEKMRRRQDSGNKPGG